MVKVPSDREVVVKHMHDNKMNKRFTFDRTFAPDSKQFDVYQVVAAPLIKEVLAGYNCTVFAYGQTGTGKTHTMIGDETPQTNSSWDDVSTGFRLNNSHNLLKNGKFIQNSLEWKMTSSCRSLISK